MQKLKQQQLFDRILEKLPDHVTLLLVILSGFLLARLTWMLFPADPSLVSQANQNAPAAPVVEVIPANARPTDLGKEIAAYHLLGVYQPPQAAPVAAAPVVEAPPPVPDTPRDPIKLVGVYALPDNRGVAVIDVKGQQRVVGVGETIEGNGATLQKVFSDKVELSWNGQVETIDMPKMTESANGAIVVEQEFIPEPEMEPVMEQPMPDQLMLEQQQKTQQQIQQEESEDEEGASTQQVAPPQLQAPSGGSIQQPAIDPEASANPSSLASFRQQVAANNMKLLDLVKPSPVSQKGQLTGFRVAPGNNEALFRQTGLQAGDIVTAINGTPLNSNSSSLRAMQGLMSSANAQLTVLRGGQVTSLQVSF